MPGPIGGHRGGACYGRSMRARPGRADGHPRPRRGPRAVLDVLTQPVVPGELGLLGSAGTTLGMPLRGRGLVFELPRAGRGVTAQLTRDRRRAPAEPPSDLADAHPSCAVDRDVLTLVERQPPVGDLADEPGVDPAGSLEPPEPDRCGHPRSLARVLGLGALGDRCPEPCTVLPPRDRRCAGRRDLPSVELDLLLPFPHRCHNTSPVSSGRSVAMTP